MKLNNVREALKGYQKGSFIRVGWKSNIESASAKRTGVEVVKVSEATVRIGINYSNIKSVQLTRATREGDSKPYKVWFKHIEDLPAIIEHLQDENKKYLQIFSVNKNSHPRVCYYINGVPATKKQVMESGFCNASAFTEKESIMTFNIPIENLRFVGNYQ